jgi:two-component system, response regulator
MRPDIMIVDDSTDQLELMRMAFKMVAPDLHVTTCESGDEALDALKGDSLPKVILLDLKMPGRDGFEVLKDLKSDPVKRKIPVCIFSNGDLENDICYSYATGASGYFKKPTGLEELKSFIGYFSQFWFKYCSLCSCPKA